MQRLGDAVGDVADEWGVGVCVAGEKCGGPFHRAEIGAENQGRPFERVGSGCAERLAAGGEGVLQGEVRSVPGRLQVERRDFTGVSDAMGPGVEACQGADAAFSGQQALPHSGNADAEGADCAEAGHDDVSGSGFQVLCPVMNPVP